jgi:hypothetical protein
MTMGLFIILIVALPFIWVQILQSQHLNIENVRFSDLLIVGLIPHVLTYLSITICRKDVPINAVVVMSSLLVFFTTFSWGYCMLNGHKMKLWLYIIMAILTLVKFLILLIWVIFSDPPSFNFQF